MSSRNKPRYWVRPKVTFGEDFKQPYVCLESDPVATEYQKNV